MGIAPKIFIVADGNVIYIKAFTSVSSYKLRALQIQIYFIVSGINPKLITQHPKLLYPNTHVSLLPPPCDELTTKEPSVNATLVNPPGTISIPSGPYNA